MVRRKRTDENHKRIARALRERGALVDDTSSVGGGFPDLVVYYRGRFYLIEVKTEKGKLNKKQQEWHQQRPSPDLLVVRSEEDLWPFM